MHIALLANLRENAPVLPGISADHWDDLDSSETIEAITAALESSGHQVTFMEADASLYERLRRQRPDICFNIAEGHFGDSREAQVPALLEMLRLPYTGSGVLTMALSLDKPMTKRVLSHHNLPTPPFQVFERLAKFAPIPLDRASLARQHLAARQMYKFLRLSLSMSPEYLYSLIWQPNHPDVCSILGDHLWLEFLD